jgi:hypothetical protein
VCRGDAHGVDVVVVCAVPLLPVDGVVAVDPDELLPDDVEEEEEVEEEVEEDVTGAGGGAAGAGVTFGVGNGVVSETYGSSVTCAGRTMWSCPDAAATMRDGVSSSDTANSACRCELCSNVS